jgi:fumarate reductase flavoprotein subunit
MKTTILITALAILFLSIPGCKPAEVNVKEIDLTKISDGEYEGYAENMNKARVKVSIENHRITEIELLQFDATKFGQDAKDSIPQRIIDAQTPYVDAVSGATEASNAIINATVDALTTGTGNPQE